MSHWHLSLSLSGSLGISVSSHPLLVKVIQANPLLFEASVETDRQGSFHSRSNQFEAVETRLPANVPAGQVGMRNSRAAGTPPGAGVDQARIATTFPNIETRDL